MWKSRMRQATWKNMKSWVISRSAQRPSEWALSWGTWKLKRLCSTWRALRRSWSRKWSRASERLSLNSARRWLWRGWERWWYHRKCWLSQNIKSLKHNTIGRGRRCWTEKTLLSRQLRHWRGKTWSTWGSQGLKTSCRKMCWGLLKHWELLAFKYGCSPETKLRLQSVLPSAQVSRIGDNKYSKLRTQMKLTVR